MLLIQLIQKVDLLLAHIENYDVRMASLEAKLFKLENEITSVS